MNASVTVKYHPGDAAMRACPADGERRAFAVIASAAKQSPAGRSN
jgi:hypothetical protein